VATSRLRRTDEQSGQTNRVQTVTENRQTERTAAIRALKSGQISAGKDQFQDLKSGQIQVAISNLKNPEG
jgi:hypothetical protein